MILLDTSALVSSLSEARRGWPDLRRLIEGGAIVRLSSIVLYEWRRGPRTPGELEIQREIFPDAEAIPFGWEEAVLSAKLYSSLPRSRARAADFAIAACALRHDAGLWTLNPADFADIFGLRLSAPASLC